MAAAEGSGGFGAFGGSGRGGGGGRGPQVACATPPPPQPTRESLAKWNLNGYQVDFDANNQWGGNIYEQGGRGIISTPGHALLAEPGQPVRVTATLADKPTLDSWFHKDDYNHFDGDRAGPYGVVTYMNGHLVMMLVDHDPAYFRATGLIAPGSGSNGRVLGEEDIYLKKLLSADPSSRVSVGRAESGGARGWTSREKAGLSACVCGVPTLARAHGAVHLLRRVGGLPTTRGSRSRDGSQRGEASLSRASSKDIRFLGTNDSVLCAYGNETERLSRTANGRTTMMKKTGLMTAVVALAAITCVIAWADWPSASGGPARDGWARGETGMSLSTAKDIRFLYAHKFEGAARGESGLATPLVLSRIVTWKGFKALLFMGAGNDTVYAIDSEISREYFKGAAGIQGRQAAGHDIDPGVSRRVDGWYRDSGHNRSGCARWRWTRRQWSEWRPWRRRRWWRARYTAGSAALRLRVGQQWLAALGSRTGWRRCRGTAREVCAG